MGRNKRKPLNKQKLKRGSISAIVTFSFIIAVVLVNIIVGVISDRTTLSADLTAESIYTLDEQTELYLDTSPSSDVAITVLNTQSGFESDANNKQVSEILKKIANLNSHISLEYLDIDQNPNFTSKFKGETLSEGDIVVESEQNDRYRIITPTDYFGLTSEQEMAYYYYYGIVGGYYIEQEVVSAMLYAASDEVVNVVFTEGYGEGDSSTFEELLTKNGYNVETIALTTTDRISDDVDFIVIYAPTIDIDPADLSKLDEFLENDGKSVLYFASTMQPETPNIESFLNEWGLSAGYYAIGQSDSQYLMSAVTLYAHLQQILSTDYTTSVLSKDLYMLGADLRPIYTLEQSDVTITPLVTTYDGAFLFPLDLDSGDSFEVDNAQTDVYNDIVLSSNGSSNLCVVGSETFAGSVLLSYTNSANADFFIGLFGSISGKEDQIVISPKPFTQITFEMNAETANTLGVILCIALPLVIIAGGIGVWVYRRHK